MDLAKVGVADSCCGLVEQQDERGSQRPASGQGMLGRVPGNIHFDGKYSTRSVSLPVFPCLCLFVCVFVCLFVCVCVCLFVC